MHIHASGKPLLQIIEVLPTKHWRHVPLKENPADIASRSIDLKCFLHCDLWWSGPSWLLLDPSHWPKDELNSKKFHEQIKSEQKSDKKISFHTYTPNDIFDNFFQKHFQKLSAFLHIYRDLLKNDEFDIVHSLLTPCHFHSLVVITCTSDVLFQSRARTSW